MPKTLNLNLILTAVIFGATFHSSAVSAGVPTFGAAEFAQQVIMVDQLRTQVTQMKNQLSAISGNRGLGQIYNDPSLRNYLPPEWVGVYDKVKSGQLNGIRNMTQTILKDEGFNKAATGGEKRYQDTLAINKAITMQSYAQTEARLNNIKELMKQADATQDAKAAADLQNRLIAENAMIQNEQTRLNLAMQLQAVELKLAEEQRSREFKERFIK